MSAPQPTPGPYVVEHRGKVVGPFPDAGMALSWTLAPLLVGDWVGVRRHWDDLVRSLEETDKPVAPNVLTG